MAAAVLEQRPQALAMARRGDADAFGLLLEPLLDPGYRLAAVMLADRGAAEDAVQEAALKAWRKLGGFKGGAESMRSWFLSIVANECRMTRRRTWWSVVRSAEIPRSEPGPPPGHSDLREAVRALSPDDRLPLVLHFYLDLPIDEVARTLGVSEAAARSRIYRAAKKLRVTLTTEEVF